MIMNYKSLRATIHWLLLVLTLLFIISGWGITRWQIVEPLTLGLLTKSLATKIHLNLVIPFLLVLGLHVYLVLKNKRIR